MSRKSKWYVMTAMLLGGTLFQLGCGILNSFGGFWDGFSNGWPSDWGTKLIIDILNEELFS